MTLRLLLALLSIGLSLVALAPSASAAAPIDCGGATNLWGVEYHCTYDGFGATGTLSLCPPGMLCYSSIYCATEVSPLTLGCNLP